MSTDVDANAFPPAATDGLVMGKDGMAALVDVLIGRGFTVIGPTVRDSAIVLAELRSADELPYGWGVELEAGGTGCASGQTARPSRTRRAPSPGSRSCILRGCGSGAPTGWRASWSSRPTRPRLPGTPSSACVPATCGPSPSRTGY